jgi:membrane associated rhomboid family serine protease
MDRVMWVFLPIGHDQGIRRFPWVTAGIAALCLLVQVQRSLGGASEDELLAASDERARLESEILLPYLKADAQATGGGPIRQGSNMWKQMEAWQAKQESLLARLRDGSLTGPDDPSYQAWLAARDRERQLLKRDLANRMGYRPSDGLSLGLVLSAFAHGGWMHLLGNLLFLYLVGCNLEDRWGRGVFSGFYLAGAVVSALVFYLWHRGSDTVLVGASGAVAAAMGAFLVCFHRSRIRFLSWSLLRGARTVELYAFWVFPLWFLEQTVSSWLEAHVRTGVAYSAHVGGFAFGVVVAGALKLSGIERRHLLPLTEKGTEWREDPDFLAALDLIGTRDLTAAVPRLQAVLARSPRHQGALEQLARTSVALRDPALAGPAVSAYLTALARTRMTEVLPLVDELRLVDGTVALDDRAGAVVVRAAAQGNRPQDAIKVASALLRQHPSSPLAPGVMWEVARLQEQHGHADLARQTRQQLVARYPNDPFAEQARVRLGA